MTKLSPSPTDQSSFPCFQEVKNKLAANAPTLAIYVDYKKAYDRLWDMGLLVEFFGLGISMNLLQDARIVVGETEPST